MKIRLLLAGFAVTLLVIFLAATVVAQEGEVPPPYAGMKNPFSWDDASAQAAGKEIYRRSCQSCHGINGAAIAASDFSQASFSDSLEESTDFHFWILSEGRLDRGMPPFKSSLSEEQRWQVLTYVRTLGEATPPAETPLPTPVTSDATVYLELPRQADSGQPLTLTAQLQDSQGKSIEGATIKFFIKTDFFTTGLMEIGEAMTDDKGVAVIDYIPRHTGEVEVLARYESIDTAAAIRFPDTDKHFYRTEAGIDIPVPGQEGFIGPETHLALGEGGSAPPTVLRLPTGSLAWLTPLLLAVMAIWSVYFYVVYQLYQLPVAGGTGDAGIRRLPLIGLAVVTFLGILLVLMLVTSPLSHPHVP